jgi:hypothetical protein
MNPDSPGEQQAAVTSPRISASPLPVAPSPNVYQQAPALTSPVSAPLDEVEVPEMVAAPEEESIPQEDEAQPVLEPMAIEESCMDLEETLMAAAASATVPDPIPPPFVAPEIAETETVDVKPAVPVSEIPQIEQIQGEAEILTETPSGKRPRTKKPKSAAKAGKSKSKKEADSWMDGEALSSAGADTNDEVKSCLTSMFTGKLIIQIGRIFFIGQTTKAKEDTYFKKESQKGRNWCRSGQWGRY